MKKSLVVFVLMVPGVTFAAKIKNPKCEEFTTVNEKFSPQYLAVVDGYNKSGKETSEEVDLGGIVTDASTVKQECAKAKNKRIESIIKSQHSESKKSPVAAAAKTSVINPVTAKCSDFVGVSEDLQPLAVFWVAGHDKTGKIKKNGEITEEFLETPVTTLIEDCKTQPTASFYDRAKAWIKTHV